MSERDRYKETPALAHAAEAACSYYLTDGFCMPRSYQGCKCWDRAQATMEATGLSARAVGWIFQNRSRIEKQAESDEKQTYGGTPWWSRPASPTNGADSPTGKGQAPVDESAVLGTQKPAKPFVSAHLSTSTRSPE